ncbi:hypothetical protein [Pseudomonas oryzihabitans]|nr:hypothetical protein [Pseudomonas oryzihabitans]
MITAQSLDTPAHGLAFTQPSLAPSPHEQSRQACSKMFGGKGIQG